MRYAAEVSYNGSLFSGWQIQNGQRSVQEEIERVLTLLNGSSVKVAGAGRTDAGVNARAQVCSFDLDKEWRTDRLQLAINANLASGVQFMRTAKTRDTFHARFDAVSREYMYFMWHGRAIYPQIEPFVCQIKGAGYDWALAEKACRYLEGEHDFRNFCKKTEVPDNAVRTLYKVRLRKRGNLIRLHVKGNGFLTNMVRIIVGNLEQVAKGNKPPEWINSLYTAETQREDGGRTFPPYGLFLWKINYEEELFPRRG